MPGFAFQRVAVVGPGLLGGSIGLALRAMKNPPEVRAWARRQETLELLRERGCADAVGGDLPAIIDGADLIVLATPVGAMLDLAGKIAACPGFSKDAVVTDMGSVKQCVVEDLERVFRSAGRGRFVGSHPMAGSEKAGVGAAHAELFAGAVCLLTPTEATDPAALVAVENFWNALGMSTRRLAADVHDREMARISHLPHLTAAALVMATVDEAASNAELAGRGFRDSTRIASGQPGMWTEILLENRAAVAAELRGLQEQLGETLAFLENVNEGDLHRFLAEAKRRRDMFGAPSSSAAAASLEEE